ncbi:hypothetical protein ACSQ67_015009 [Phaseolus vulgaris]
MEEFCNAGDDQLQMLKTLQETARLEVDKMMLTDAPLLFPPGQLALAALGNSNALHKVVDFDSYLGSILSRQNSMHTMAELDESLHAIDSCVKKYKIPSEKELKHINRKLSLVGVIALTTRARSGKRNQSTSPNGAQVKHKICHLLSSVIFISNGLEFFSFFLSNVERLRARSLLKTPACLLVSLVLLYAPQLTFIFCA